MQRLYNLGGRKFAIAGLGKMGCIPSILAQSPTGNCSDAVNNLVQPFNANVKKMINNLNSKLPASKFIYIDIDNMFRDILASPADYGILYCLSTLEFFINFFPFIWFISYIHI